MKAQEVTAEVIPEAEALAEAVTPEAEEDASDI